MKSNFCFDNSLMNRIQQLYENSKVSDKKKKLDFTSPLEFKKNSPLSSNSSFYEKYSKIWLKNTVSPVSIKFFVVVLSKLRQKVIGRSFRLLSLIQSDPLAFTRCPKCDHIGLTLLTTSTKDHLSPRFLENIKAILPSKPQNCKKNLQSSFEKEKIGSFSKRKKEISNKNSLVLFTEDHSPEKKNLISDLSEIQPNPYFLSSLSSPEGFQKSKENRICKAKDEISFDISRDSIDMFKDANSYGCIQKKTVPKLNFSDLVTNNPDGLKIDKERLLMCVKNIFFKRIQLGFDKIKGTTKFEKSKTQIVTSNKTDEKNNLGKIQQRMISNSKKTAFKILNSRLEKFIFRRKMQGFYSISEILYR